ncbi:glycosyltransferase family 9 protein [Robiginitalea aurantiaca]|uniref:Glycosyltransferase family 9 protein n=1 Tax=Robiginitalea aurantiaca TaxID=3056915 RepID=A0ABT7WAG9_9FLAO|nr:glycosyltransferase family 9 protein [Robiginitalea aurantiaca]MDM9629913.1 glycosyltransferase family 9 protein [Robiginitalea aurantiaca]
MGGSSSRRILVFRLSALGDVAMTVPVLLSVARSNPGVSFLFVTKSHFKPILQRVPNLEVHSFDANGTHKGLTGLRRLRAELKQKPFNSIADLHSVLRTRILKILFAGSGIPFVRLDKGRKEKRQLTAWDHKVFVPLRSTHDRYADVFRSLGFKADPGPEDILKREAWPESFEDYRLEKESINIGFAPFAAHQGKCYPEEQVKDLLALLGGLPQVRVYLFGGGKRESNILSTWEKEYSHCVSVAGKASLSDELALISNLRLMVSMDSGNGHLAAMYGLPVITLWGVTHPYAGFSPFGQPAENSMLADREKFPAIPTSVYGNKQPKGYDEVMDSIPPTRVFKRISEILKLGRPKK